MRDAVAGRLGRRFYYGWVVVAITCLTTLVSAGMRSAPATLIKPLEEDFGWSRASISVAMSIGLFLYGVASPLAGTLMDRFGPRRLMIGGMTLAGVASLLSAFMSSIWQFNLLWGFFSGIGTGLAGAVLGAAVATRWFNERRGLVIGIFGAASSAGQLVFLPTLVALIVEIGWQSAVLVMAVVVGVLVPLIVLLMRDDPSELGLRPYGAATTASDAPPERPTVVMWRAMHVRDFWLLAIGFCICGATSAGLIGAHLIAFSVDQGLSEVTAAAALGLMGITNFIGTVGSGWLTDRYNPRHLLASYLILRSGFLLFLPFVHSSATLAVFSLVFGLNYIATSPPMVAMIADLFGRRNVGTVYGWIFFAHHTGAAIAATLAGVTRDVAGSYNIAFLAGACLSLVAGVMISQVRGTPAPRFQQELAGT